MISGNVPGHLTAGARVGFIKAMTAGTPQWQKIAGVHNMDGSSQQFVDLGTAPWPTESKTGTTYQDYIEKTLSVTPKDWDVTIHISYNALQDDRTGQLKGLSGSAAENFNMHMDEIVFSALNSGAGATYGLCYDGQYFFDTDHVDKGADYQTSQDNVNTLTLNHDNFQTVYVAQTGFLTDRGKPFGRAPNLLVVPYALEHTAAQITGNPATYDTANREVNTYSGKVNYIVSPWLDSTAWYTLHTSANVKPLYLVMRERPHLQHSWFEPKKPDGGWYMFKYYARYWVMYGDWRLASQGNT